MGLLAGLAGLAGLVLVCLLAIWGFAQGDRWLQLRSLRRRARAAVADQGVVRVLGEIDEELGALRAEKRDVKRSAAAYATVGSGPGAVISLNARIVELEEYRRAVTEVAE